MSNKKHHAQIQQQQYHSVFFQNDFSLCTNTNEGMKFTAKQAIEQRERARRVICECAKERASSLFFFRKKISIKFKWKRKTQLSTELRS